MMPAIRHWSGVDGSFHREETTRDLALVSTTAEDAAVEGTVVIVIGETFLICMGLSTSGYTA